VSMGLCFSRVKMIQILFTAGLLVIWAGCTGEKIEEKNATLPSIKDVSEIAWEKLSKKRIFFGHQSIGNNVIDGMRDVMKENPAIKLDIVETRDMEGLRRPVFAHTHVGKNEDPNSKCEDFTNLIKKGSGDVLDFAALKFCYIDITSATDVGSVFKSYSNTVSSLKEMKSGMKIIHVTVPLKVVQGGFRAWMKRTLRRPIGGYSDNIKRAEYNEKVRIEYTGKDPIFDLARVESTFADGRRCTFLMDGKAYESLVPEYTDDGRHLNQKGRRWVAEQFLIFLANLSTR